MEAVFLGSFFFDLHADAQKNGFFASGCRLHPDCFPVRRRYAAAWARRDEKTRVLPAIRKANQGKGSQR
jgi:hypothetical protein